MKRTATLTPLLFVFLICMGTVYAAIFSPSKPLQTPLTSKGHTLGILAEPSPQLINVQYESRSSMGTSMTSMAGGAANDRKTRHDLNRVIDSTEVQEELYNTIAKALAAAGAPATIKENLYLSAHPKSFPVTKVDGYEIPDFTTVIKQKHLDYLLYIRYSAGLGTNGGPFAKPTAYIEGRYFVLNAKGELLATENYNTRADYYNPIDAKTAIGNPKEFHQGLRSAMQQFSKTLCSRLQLSCG